MKCARNVVYGYPVAAVLLVALILIAAPRTPAIHQPLRVGPCAFAHLNGTNVVQELLSPPAKEVLLNLDEREHYEEQSEN